MFLNLLLAYVLLLFLNPLIFFFQAEDGIRDYKVTGVQTCALPIFDNAAGACTPGMTKRLGGSPSDAQPAVGNDIAAIAAYLTSGISGRAADCKIACSKKVTS